MSSSDEDTMPRKSTRRDSRSGGYDSNEVYYGELRRCHISRREAWLKSRPNSVCQEVINTQLPVVRTTTKRASSCSNCPNKKKSFIDVKSLTKEINIAAGTQRQSSSFQPAPPSVDSLSNVTEKKNLPVNEKSAETDKSANLNPDEKTFH